jgi:hypothetical protein
MVGCGGACEVVELSVFGFGLRVGLGIGKLHGGDYLMCG